MKAFLAAFAGTLAIVSTGAASTQPVLGACQTTLMSSPSCVNHINATSFCRNMGNTQEVAKTAADCLALMSPNARPSNDVIGMCLAGFATSSRDADNETLCK